jgi:CheY-like chemotaxis protein
MTAESPLPTSSSARLAVIVAEDNHSLRRYFADVLDIAGYEVLPAYDGLDALGLLFARPDVGVLITDIEMPRLDGFTLARCARQCRSEIAILYVSALELTEVVRCAVPESSFLPKPCSPNALQAAMLALCPSI